MGGNAFAKTLTALTFPRLPPPVYATLKSLLTPRLEALYARVAVPREAPGKTDHGDLDFVVTSCRCGETTTSANKTAAGAVPHIEVLRALGATHMNPLAGNRTSNYAVPIPREIWPPVGPGDHDDDDAQKQESPERYCQVDVHVCKDEDELDRVLFMHGYGDLGMIVGSMVKRSGLYLSTKGFKIPNPPHPHFDLSTSLPDILSFLGLSLDVWNAGFATQEAAFEWVATSRLFGAGKPFSSLASRLGRDEDNDDHDGGASQQRRDEHSKVKPDRKMFWAFVEWAASREDARRRDSAGGKPSTTALREEALVHFHRKDAKDAHERSVRERGARKTAFNGNKVGAWIGYIGRWREVKVVMDAVRARLGGDERVLELVSREGEEVLRGVVLEVAHELGFVVMRG